MASEQAKEMAQRYASVRERTSKPDLDLATRRDIDESLHSLAREPERVSFAEVDADGVPALWCIPEGSDAEHVEEEGAAKPADQVCDTAHGAGYDGVLLAGERPQLRKLDRAFLDGGDVRVGEQLPAHCCQLGLDLVAESLCPHSNRLVAGGWRRTFSTSDNHRPLLGR